MKKYIMGLAIFALLTVPSLSSADTASNLQVQINALLEQVRILQVQINAIRSTNQVGAQAIISSIQNTSTSAISQCIKLNLTHKLKKRSKDGITRGEVTKLQKFLALDKSIYPEGLITGFFGPMTERAVKAWQRKHGVVSSGSPSTTGYGVVGPATRAKMRSVCSLSKVINTKGTSNTVNLTVTSAMIVSLGEEFTLKKGETAQVKGLNVFLKVKDFIYSPCPKGFACFLSGLAVIYELTVDGKVYNTSLGNHLPPEAPYDVLVKNTDYKTYADFVIEKPETICANRSGISQDECWRWLAIRYNDLIYCNKIQSIITKDACFEDLAEQLKNDNLCQNVVSPKQYCQYLKLVSQNALAQCDSTIIFRWRVSCFKEIANKSGQGINICDTLEPNKATICREAISGLDY